ncbi:hypothetical protein PMX22_19730 [Clostridium butyricum]|uniref:hypothetical protein n=1 Tax=Clostridium butyricum TaxID=1492 RepID=UPI00232D8706|nr:hypothetical protein [Clostridium butyricum]MDB2162019.1 hypothetical protein [Clostridium butyricum]
MIKELKGIKILEVVGSEQNIIEEINFVDTTNNKVIRIEFIEDMITTVVIKGGRTKHYNRLLKKYERVVDYVSKHLADMRNQVAEIVNKDSEEIEAGATFSSFLHNRISTMKKDNIKIHKYCYSDDIVVMIDDKFTYECRFEQDSEFYRNLNKIFNKTVCITIDDENNIVEIKIDYENIELKHDESGLYTLNKKYENVIKGIVRRKNKLVNQASEIIKIDKVCEQNYDKDDAMLYMNDIVKNVNVGIENGLLISYSKRQYKISVGLSDYCELNVNLNSNSKLYQMIKDKYKGLFE